MDRIVYPCGCCNGIDPEWGLKRCLEKCRSHIEARANQPNGAAYYQLLGVLKDGAQAGCAHVAELEAAIGPLPPAPPYEGSMERSARALALEVGCGASMYVPAVRQAGYAYVGVDADPWAAKWIEEEYAGRQKLSDVKGMAVGFMELPEPPQPACGLVLAAHSIEHMEDAPAALRKIHRLLTPGGWLVLVLPDDRDTTNPDHWWFFTEPLLRRTLAKIGFGEILAVTRKIVPHEDFIYCRCRKEEK